jgi:hypothetical protein
MKRTGSVLLALGALVAAPGSIAPAHADPDFSGFSTRATATPLKVEVYEPAIPIPAEPQAEFDFSYTRVDGASGPISAARASALWPGDSVGEGWKTVGEALGMPDTLTKDGYPEQVNAESPGDTTQASQEPFPGVVARVSASDQKAIAKVGYSSGGDVQEDQPDDAAAQDPLSALVTGDLSALGGAITGSSGGSADDPSTGSPLGPLAVLVDAGAMHSVSSTDYSGGAVLARSTSRLGEISLVAGLVKLTGVEVAATTTSNVGTGAKSNYHIHIGGMTIAGQPYSIGPDGIERGGSTTPMPGLPSDPADALKALGISIEMPKPEVLSEGAEGGVNARGLKITIDTQPLRAKLPELPLGELVNQLPDAAAQLKSLLLAATDAHPKLVVSLGVVTTDAMTVAGFGADETATTPTAAGVAGRAGTTGSAVAGAAAAPPAAPGEAPPTDGPPAATTALEALSAVPGLPPLGSIPMVLGLLGLFLASGAGWYLRRAGLLLFGAAGTCVHGLKAGVPDLRKA